MARSENQRSRTERPEMESTMAAPNPEELKQKVDEFGEKIQQLRQRGIDASKEWLDELERRQESLRNSLAHYSKEQGGQLAKGSQFVWETTKRQADWMLTAADRQVQTNFQNLRDYVDRNQEVWKKGASEFAEAVRKPWVDLANAFDGVFGRAQEGPSRGKRQDESAREGPR
jgi:exonuclease VII large subunit